MSGIEKTDEVPIQVSRKRTNDGKKKIVDFKVFSFDYQYYYFPLLIMQYFVQEGKFYLLNK